MWHMHGKASSMCRSCGSQLTGVVVTACTSKLDSKCICYMRRALHGKPTATAPQPPSRGYHFTVELSYPVEAAVIKCPHQAVLLAWAAAAWSEPSAYAVDWPSAMEVAAPTQVALADPQNGMRAGAALTAHAGGLLALDCREDLVATCGLGLRLGQPVADQYVKVLAAHRSSPTEQPPLHASR